MIVGCSFGPDSLALADAVLALPGDTHLVHLVYVDHGLRPEAAGEGARVIAFAEAAGGQGRIVRVTVTRDGTGLEDAARRVRHAALLAVADEVGARWVLLGHTASDQAETVLGRLLRGAGVKGLAGIAARRGRFLRPLLTVSRAQVLDHVAGRGLEPAHDPMNDDRSFLRARLRHELLPALRRENPRVEAALCRSARSLRETADALEWATARATAELGAGPRISAPALAALPPAIAKRVLGDRAASVSGVSLEARHLDAALALVRRTPGGSSELHLPGLVLRREYDDLHFTPLWRALPDPVPDQVTNRVTNQVTIDDGTPPDGPYLVRTWQPGDRMRPPSLRGHSRKLSDLFIDRKIPAAVRRRALVVVRARDGAIVWAEHIGPSVDARLQVALTRRDPPAI